jgi:adenylate cyclase
VTNPVLTYFKQDRVSAVCVCFAVVWIVIATSLIYLYPYPFDNLNSRIYDWKLNLSPARGQSSDIVHLDVDDQAVKEIGSPWPWNREVSAAILNKLTEFGARVVAFDIFYSTPGKGKGGEEGDQAFFEAIKRAGNVISATGLGTLTDSRDDRPLELPQDRSRADALYDKSWPFEVPQRLSLLRVLRMQGAALPLLPIIEDSKAVGHITANPDRDGVYRKIALLVKLEDRCVPSLSLAALMAYWNLPPEAIVLSGKNEIEIKRPAGTTRIPIDSKGMILVNWGQPWKSFKHYSAKDLLSHTPDPQRAARYKDKIVIVAVTATGNSDFGTTPLSINSPLSRIHSHALNTILADSFISRIPVCPWIVVSSILVALLFPLIFARLGLKTQVGLACSICVFAAVASAVCFRLWSYDAPLTEFYFTILPTVCATLFVKGASVEWQAAQAKFALEQYLPPEYVEKALSSGTPLDFSPKRQELTVVFVDIQGFSTLSEVVDIEYVNGFLKDFYYGMTQVAIKHQGRIHAFLGDGFLAVFGDLIPIENHAEAAVAASIEMQKAMAALSGQWARSGIQQFAKGIKIRIGINTGMVFAGDLGGGGHLEYTIVGSAVNIASRLQALAPPGGIMLTARTRALAPNADICGEPENVRLRGFEKDTQVYKLCPETIEDAKVIEMASRRP